MKKKVIALADNSYTIRRIVELSFSEIENIDVHSFENGSGLKEKLLQLVPDVVIVDIKLPEINGYDICRFINETPALSHSRVFLMKGSFEAVDNEMIKNLKYEDIVTKPFDSNAMVSSVVKLLNQEVQKNPGEFADEEPSSFPEDIIEIETDAPVTDGISFSDIRLDLDSPAPAGNAAPRNQVLERDEILPSEEITQGTQPSKDALLAPESEEIIQNPFNEEPLLEEAKLPADELAAPMVQKSKIGSALENSPSGSVPGDISDEYHLRFQKVVDEDTSDKLLKPSLEATRLAERDAMKFTTNADDDFFAVDEKKPAGDMTKNAGAAPAQTMFSEKDDMFDFESAEQKQNAVKAPEIPLEKILEKEVFIQKIRPEVTSPQAELDKLSQIPKKEIKTEPKAEAGLSLKDKLDLTGKLEDKLTVTIKELLWEIVPSLAEKIIKEEIDKIKSEANDTGF